MLRLWTGPMRGDQKVTVLGPLRNREPETTASEFLAKIRDGQCKSALQSFHEDPRDVKRDCAKEGVDPLRTWRLVDRHDSFNESQMTFEYASTKVPLSAHEWLAMKVERTSDAWRVTMYGRVY